MPSPLKFIEMNDIETKAVDWLWYPYIPFGKVSLINGDPGEGKTTFVLNLAAALTNAWKLPNDSSGREPINVIYQTAEDGLADTIKPRLEHAGADCSRISVIDDTVRPLTMTDERLSAAIAQKNAKLMVLDPIQAYLGADVDLNRANETRPIFTNLAKTAEETGCAIVLVGHMNKMSGIKAAYRGLGSIDIQGAARSVLIVGRLRDRPTVRIVAVSKSSLAPEGQPIAFELNPQSGFAWLDEAFDITADQLLTGCYDDSKADSAEKFLMETLKNGTLPQKEIIQKAKDRGIAERTLQTAKSNIKVTSKKMGNQWYWGLP